MSDKPREPSGEQIINRWSFDFYVFQAFSAFRNGDYTAFTHFINIIESVVVRPVDGHPDMILKLRLMQFLSRINNGDKLDLTFEEPKTPLESALDVLENICRDMSVPHTEQQLIRHAISEMLVMVCIRSGEFEKAEEMLKHFSSSSDSAGKKKLLLNLIRCRRSSHSVLQLSSYSHFKQDMLQFVERLFSVPEPFLLQMLRRSGWSSKSPEVRRSTLNNQRSTVKTSKHTPQHSSAAEDHGAECVSAVSLQGLQQVFGLLSEQYGVSITFLQLQDCVETEAQQQEDGGASGPELCLTLSETPMQTAALSDTEEQEEQSRYAGMTISRLVQEEDSQISAEHTHIEEEEEEEEEQTHTHRSGDWVVVLSDLESDDLDVQTRPVSSPSLRHTPTTRQNQHSSGSEPQCSSTQRSTPARLCKRSNTRVHRVSESQSSAAHRSTPASPPHPSGSRSSTRKKTPSRRRIIESSDSEDEEEQTTPAAATHTPRGQRQHRCVRVSSGSEPEADSTSPAAHTRRSTPTSTPGRRTHTTKRSRWLDASGTQENWSDEDSLFHTSSATANKNTRKKMWSVQESEWLKQGVLRYGAGHWERIRSSFPFSGRTAVNLKDRWRTMVKLKMV
ncbi:telomeric repeat binding factor a [Danio aesculapii]|uniref:telomeric repeat binding factor a n=1 Tax=Danio aesculapii TaxID=1142201 RepID=UPI0024C0BC51|nr:telomeric repeat binding factor a [Danio aesculapii]